MNRVPPPSSSAASSRSVSTSTFSSGDTSLSIDELYTPRVDQNETYQYVLKILILEYINEPRFRIIGNQVRNLLQEDAIGNGNNNSIASEQAILQVTAVSLETYLMNVTMNKIKVSDVSFRRSLLKFYNDMYLNPSTSNVIKDMNRFEELFIYFTKIANNEINKINQIQNNNVQEELYKQIQLFVNLIILLLPSNIDNSFKEKLNQLKEVLNPTGTSSRQNRYSIDLSSNVNKNANADKVRTPTFRIEEITHCSYLMEIFNIPAIKFQQDIIKVMNECKNEIYITELEHIHQNILRDNGSLIKEDFQDEDSYYNWKNFELHEIKKLSEKFEMKTNPGNNHQLSANTLIPTNAEDLYVSLVSLVLERELSRNQVKLEISKDAAFFIFKIVKYWRLDFPTTMSSLIYSAANFKVLKGNLINSSMIDQVFTVIYNRILYDERFKNSNTWNIRDKRRWLSNLLYTSNQCINSICTLLSNLFDEKKPRFSDILSFYYSFIEGDPSYLQYKKNDNNMLNQWCKKFRRVIFKATENYYISLIDTIPRDKSIQIENIQDIAEQILLQLQALQKKYKKPLFDKVNIPIEISNFLIEAVISDIPTIIERIKKYRHDTAPSNALSTYMILSELRFVYYQTQPNKSFPLSLEKLFIKYLLSLCNNTSEKITEVVQTSLSNEEWVKINDTTPYSSSVLDIFKMLNESLSIFINLNWENKYQIAKIITFLLKSFSDSIHLYSMTLLQVIDSDLSRDVEDYEFRNLELKESITLCKINAEKKQKTWFFSEMKKALISGTIEIPRPYEYTRRTCVILNNLDAMISKVNDLGEQFKAEEISATVHKFEKEKKLAESQNKVHDMHLIYSLRVVAAENLKPLKMNEIPDVFVSIVNTDESKEISKTNIISKTYNPVWDEEFELEEIKGNTCLLSFNIWQNYSSQKLRRSEKYELCGKATLLLDSKKFKDDGLPSDIILDLDTQGKLFLQVSLENEQLDALFCIGRAYRTFTRARDRAIKQIVHKFSDFITFTFSRETLKNVVLRAKGSKSKDCYYDPLIPLFDYLNANLNILASELTQELLFKIIINAWIKTLHVVDSLLLPSLSVVKHKKHVANNGKKSIWDDAKNLSLGTNDQIPSFGRPLTQFEVELIFMWIETLCVDFFHNGGEGPPLVELKNGYYQKIMLIPAFYDKSILELKREIERMTPMYMDYLNKQYSVISKNEYTTNRLKSIARQKTIMANSSKVKRKEIADVIKKESEDPLERMSETFDIILRCLIAKGEIQYVQTQLKHRAEVKKQLATESLVAAAVRGEKLR
ncbi:hypothetical protein Kpol_1030p25 [Vanderwaltozyma polyspora DSM 70294]|uniref:C2 domain-containing protein n=1 Tax=Vanderwaltozyma polyspora (strain ATCC 22028 / DSM 70294 / BCRC 21397 / CBS 2163 / NBRC 10782 / NRRL Y-8283 / UCD 57-17) TaxID=436907 RepID=A7TMU3_VANPO|nr:uncharacterized protein Kpol_1030p25 [Vanderwaltozyma polyspora DSM 70294]EDO16415.1 hypothetical protein Kpol_1030p25 [Vanderwaltozyma polyspora DSM 70294]